MIGALIDCSELYPQEITQLITICLQKFASGFAYQKGAIFGFSNNSNDDTKTVLKIAELNEQQLQQLNNVPIQNIGEERSVGLFNYEIGLRGKRNTDAA